MIRYNRTLHRPVINISDVCSSGTSGGGGRQREHEVWDRTFLVLWCHGTQCFLTGWVYNLFPSHRSGGSRTCSYYSTCLIVLFWSAPGCVCRHLSLHVFLHPSGSDSPDVWPNWLAVEAFIEWAEMCPIRVYSRWVSETSNLFLFLILFSHSCIRYVLISTIFFARILFRKDSCTTLTYVFDVRFKNNPFFWPNVLTTATILNDTQIIIKDTNAGWF